MGIQLQKFEDNVMYVASTPGNSLSSVRDFIDTIGTALGEAKEQFSILWDGRTGTFGGPIEHLAHMADLGATMLPSLKNIAIVTSSDQMRGVSEALKVFAEARGINVLVTGSFKTANHWIVNWGTHPSGLMPDGS